MREEAAAPVAARARAAAPGRRRSTAPSAAPLTLRLALPAGFSFRRTVLSHGWAFLPPFALDRERWVLHATLRLASPRGRPLVVRARLRSGRPGTVLVETGPAARGREAALREGVSRILGLREDLGAFYRAAASDPDFAWIPTCGAGRLLRAPTVYEDLVKLLCTTNCSWSLTELMVGRLVERLGQPLSRHGAPAPRRTGTRSRLKSGATETGFLVDAARGDALPERAFPTPEAMAAHGERFYRDAVRAGYRAPALAELADRVASGALDVEAWQDRARPTEELKREILGVRGVGPYAAENLLKLLGRHDGLGLDSWCRSTFARLRGRGRASDRTIRRFYDRFGDWRGLALWCDLTRGWLDEDGVPAGATAAKAPPATTREEAR